MLFKIKCPKCGDQGSMSLLDSTYNGPYRCWKCHELYTVHLENGGLKSWEPLNEEDFRRQQDKDSLKSKFKQG